LQRQHDGLFATAVKMTL